MAFDLIASTPDVKDGKDVGENVLFDGLVADYKVYLFYYPAAMPDRSLEEALRAFGEETGKNLFVNIGRLDDPQLDRIGRLFGVERYPVLIITAQDALAASNAEVMSAYVRIDHERLLASPDRTIACVKVLFNLFLQGRVSEAVSHAKWSQRTETLRALSATVSGVLKKIGDVVLDRDLVVSFAEVKLELKKSGD